MRLPPFQTLLDEHATDLHRFLVANVGPHDGADLFQDTVISALRAYPGLRSADNLRGWLFTIAHRKVIDLARARTRHADPMAEPPEVHYVDATNGDGPGTELWGAVAGLPAKQRSAVVQRYLLDRPYAEIAEVLGGSEAAARQNVRAGLQTLRRTVPDQQKQEVEQ